MLFILYSNTMAIDPNNKRNVDETSAYIQDTLLSVSAKIGEVLKDAVNEAFDGAEASVMKSISNDLSRTFKSAAKFSDTLANNTFKIANGLLSSKDLEKQMLDLSMKRSALARKIMLARAQGVELNLEDIAATKEALDLQKEALEADIGRVKGIEKNMGATGEIFTRLSKNKFFGSILDAETGLKAMRISAAKGVKGFKLLGVGIEAAMAGLGPIAIAVAAFNTLSKLFKGLIGSAFKVSQYTTEFGRNLGISYQEATRFREEMARTTRTIEEGYKTTQEFLKASAALNEEFGTRSTKISQDILDTFLETTAGMGLSEASAAKIASNIQLMDVNAKDFYTTILGTVTATEVLEGVSINTRQVLEDTANISAQTQLTFRSSNTELAKAIVLARRFGLSLNQVENIGGSLLDFESSISAELEAELVLQKDLNLNKARQAALDNDLVTLTQEIAKNLGSASEFEEMNAIERQLYAKAMNMSVEELAKTIKQGEILTMLGAKQEDSAEKLYKLAKMRKNEFTKLYGEQEYNNLKNRSDQERLNNLVTQLRDLFLDVVASPLSDYLSELTKKLSDNPEIIEDYINKFREFSVNIKTGIFQVIKFGQSMIKPFQAAYNLALGLSNIIKGIFTPFGDLFSKESYTEAADLIFNKGYKKVGESLGNTADYVRGLAIGPQIENPNLVTDYMKNIEDIDFEARSKMLEQKLDELISIVKAGGDVYIDGNKAGQALVMSSYKS